MSNAVFNILNTQQLAFYRDNFKKKATSCAYSDDFEKDRHTIEHKIVTPFRGGYNVADMSINLEHCFYVIMVVICVSGNWTGFLGYHTEAIPLLGREMVEGFSP